MRRQEIDGKRRRSCAGRLLGLAFTVAVIGGVLWWWHPDVLFDRDSEPDMDAYCGHAREYEDATRFDASSAQAVVQQFVAAADAARDLADAAPAEVREAHRRIARAGEALAERLQEAAPETMTELSRVAGEITADLAVQYGDLAGETAAVQAFASAECNLSFG